MERGNQKHRFCLGNRVSLRYPAAHSTARVQQSAARGEGRQRMAETTTVTSTDRIVEVAGIQVHLARGGTGDPLLVLPDDIGSPGWLPFYQQMAERFDVLVPSHPGYDRSSRPEWMRSVRDIAITYQSLVTSLGIERAVVVGLGLGGWVAAEMATMAPRSFKGLVLVGAMGIQPAEGEILDQALVNYIEYARAGFQDQAAFDAVFGSEPSTDQLETWDRNREMSFRIAWKPYMYSQTLSHLLGGVQAPALIVWGEHDRIVPRSSGERYARALSNARLEIVNGAGHSVAMERPAELAALIEQFVVG
jgi:pimeloyl-ACP methyl ester carboxylesterase